MSGPINSTPNLSRDFPLVDSSMKIKPDLNNSAHGGSHFDVMQAITGGVDKIRISPDGDVMGGTTHIKKAKMDWD